MCMCFLEGREGSRLPEGKEEEKKRVFETEATPIGNFKNAIQPVKNEFGMFGIHGMSIIILLLLL